MTGNRDLLRGRLFPPRTDGAVERPRLLAAVTRPLRRVTLLTAGPGMGKSWLAGALMRASERAAWVSFEPSDAQGFAAWSYVVEALAPSLGDGAAPARELLRQGFETAGIERVAAHLSNVFAGLPDTLLVLDDVHVLFGTDAWATLFAWVRSAPDALRVVLTSREVPTEYLGDLALHGELTHVDHEGFRLTAEEAHAVLSGLEGLSLSADRENRLIRDADGWVGALQLLASAERLTPGSTEDGGPAATGYLWQFLAREIVDRLEPVERDVLVVAAALPSCESAILQTCFPGVPIPSVLDSLERRIPFLGRLSVEDDARRIHPLLKVFLQERLASDVVRLQTVLQRAREAYAGE